GSWAARFRAAAPGRRVALGRDKPCSSTQSRSVSPSRLTPLFVGKKYGGRREQQRTQPCYSPNGRRARRCHRCRPRKSHLRSREPSNLSRASFCRLGFTPAPKRELVSIRSAA